MIYAALFGAAMAAGWAASIYRGGRAERETMCLLTMVWVGTIIANVATGSPAPYIFYAVLDMFGVAWFLIHQRKNWQWIPCGLFAGMMMTHTLFWTHSAGGGTEYLHRSYQDILALLGYLQIATVGWAIHERVQSRAGRTSGFGSWGLSSDWVLSLRLGNKNHARPE